MPAERLAISGMSRGMSRGEGGGGGGWKLLSTQSINVPDLWLDVEEETTVSHD